MRGWQPLQKLLEADEGPSTPLAAGRRLTATSSAPGFRPPTILTAHVLAPYPPGFARHLFDENPVPTLRLVNALLRARVRARHWRGVFLLARLRVPPDAFTLPLLLKSCAMLPSLAHGRAVHALAVRSCAAFADAFVAAALVQMYAKCSDMVASVNAHNAFEKPEMVLRTSVVTGHEQNGMAQEALDFFARNVVGQGVKPNSVTVVSVAQACSLALDVEEGKRVHHIAVKLGCELEMTVATALVDMYMKCSCHEKAMQLFCRMPKKDAVAWAAVISGLTQNGLPDESMRTFKCMLLDGPVPDAVTMVKVLAACSESGVLRQAFCLHGYLVNAGFCDKIFVAAALVDLYSKCGNLGSAVRVFESATEKDVVTWSSMIAGYGIHGLGQQAVALYQRMVASSIRPNSQTFVSLLSACSHSGLVQEGKSIFKSMTQVYGITPNIEHCGAMVDLFGRAGEFHEATELLYEMGGTADAHTWCALLAACRTHRVTDMSEVVAAKLLKLDPDHVGYYNLLTNIYAFDEKWDSVKETRGIIRDKGLNKVPGISAVEINNVLHTFTAGERSHQDWEKISTLLWELSPKLRGDDCFFQSDTHMVFADF
ncbi:hypothetical protein ACQ4PT_019603 [Festuca glaucescens]